MSVKTRGKLTVAVFVIGAIAAVVVYRWTPTGTGPDPTASWERGGLTASIQAYYSARINRIIENWRYTSGTAEFDRAGVFKESYTTLLVIDLDKQALWIEDNGQMQDNASAKLPAGMNWKLYRRTSQGTEALPPRMVLKFRGFNSSQHTPEVFYLVGTGRGAGHMRFKFHASGGTGGYHSGPFRPEPIKGSEKIENPYGSLLVTDDGYQQYRSSKIPGRPNGQTAQVPANAPIEENKARWLSVEKSLYAEIDRQMLNSLCTVD